MAKTQLAFGFGLLVVSGLVACGGSAKDDGSESGTGAATVQPAAATAAGARDDISCAFDSFSFSAALRGASATNAIEVHGFANDPTGKFRAFTVSYFQHDDFGDADHYQVYANASGDPAHNQDPTEWVVFDFFQSGGSDGDSGSVTLRANGKVETHAFGGGNDSKQFCKINGVLGGQGSTAGISASPAFAKVTARDDLACTFDKFTYSAALHGNAATNAIEIHGFAAESVAKFRAFKTVYFQKDDFGDADHYQVFANGSGDPAHNQDPAEWAVLDFHQSGGNDADSGSVTLSVKNQQVESHAFDGQAPEGVESGTRFCKVNGVAAP